MEPSTHDVRGEREGTTGFTGGEDGARTVGSVRRADRRRRHERPRRIASPIDLDEKLDPTFDGDGRPTTALTATRLDAAGDIHDRCRPEDRRRRPGGNGSFALARYDSLGTLRPYTFDGDGKVRTNCRQGRYRGCGRDQADGKIVAAGKPGFLGEWTDDSVSRAT